MIRSKHILALLTSLVALAGATLVAGSSPAEAAVGANGYLETVVSNTTCNLDTNTVSFGASIQLNSALKNGAKVSFNFAFYQVNSAGNQISPIYYHNGNSFSANPGSGWSTPVYMDTWTRRLDIMGYIDINNPTAYLGGSVTWSGHLGTQVNVAVLVGSTWQYTGWLRVPSHRSYFGGGSTVGTDCLLDW